MKLILIPVLVTSLVGSVGLGASRQAIDLSRSRLVDLTHPYNAQTIYWPTASTRFRLEKLAYGPAPGGYFYASYSFSTPEHGGTHLDAPLHFSERGRSTDQVPLDQLIAPAVVIDVSSSTAGNPDYRLSAADVQAFEKQHGQIAAGTIVLLRTGWSRRWPDVKAYSETTRPETPRSFGSRATGKMPRGCWPKSAGRAPSAWTPRQSTTDDPPTSSCTGWRRPGRSLGSRT